MSTVSLLRELEEPEHKPEPARLRTARTADEGVTEMKPPSRRFAPIILAILCMMTLNVQSSAAAKLEGVHFSDVVRAGDVTLRLSCVGLLRYKIFIKAYVAALYLGDGEVAGDVLDDVPKRLELSYFWSISGADFGKAGEHILAQNVDARTLAALRPRLDQINGWYRDVKPGDRYSLTYVPGSGTELALNGNRLGIVEGADFAAAYFRIWLGDKPIDSPLRDQLLECANGGGPDSTISRTS
jgi:hypothetical protein